MGNLNILYRSRLITAILTIFIFAAVTVTSCKKSSSPDNAKFVGTWTGEGCNGDNTCTFLAGSTGSKMNMQVDFNTFGCDKIILISETVSGNDFTITPQDITDNCNNTVSISGSGYITNGTLTITYTLTGTGTPYSCSFTGTK